MATRCQSYGRDTSLTALSRWHILASDENDGRMGFTVRPFQFHFLIEGTATA
jgi:hypothetical protein